MRMTSTKVAVTMEELETALAQPAPARFDVLSLTASMPMDVLCEMATESNGNAARTVQGLIEGVILKYGDSMDNAALAALNAVAFYHVPKMQERIQRLEGDISAN